MNPTGDQHTCEFTGSHPTQPCTFVCSCGKVTTRHKKDAPCKCANGGGVCLVCGEVIHAPEYAVWRFNDGRDIEACLECYSIYWHSSLAGIPQDRVRSLQRLAVKDCRMVDPATGATYTVHELPVELTEYDTDYNRTREFLVCRRCGMSCQHDKARSRDWGEAAARRSRAEAEKGKALEEELKSLVADGKTTAAIMRYREVHPGASRDEAIQYVKRLKLFK